ncbi:hypothetical protein [Streptomyces luteolus]|uniref:Transcriptional regulator n=1 Tax=Streptomyces luteolus TaxID=3043615 RepID=A0ABT6SUY0_9ACTN|nr:hypothetical protein [Streptomyces sp. B-S-A12]MDI3419210.1 hypothetical protein [Streptomyces sp. B-S-A12]
MPRYRTRAASARVAPVHGSAAVEALAELAAERAEHLRRAAGAEPYEHLRRAVGAEPSDST